MAVTPSGRSPLAVLARRSVVLFERSADGWALAAREDLTPWVGAASFVLRRPAGFLEAIEGDGDASTLVLRIHAAALGVAEPLELRREGAGFTRVEAAALAPNAGSASPPPGARPRTLEWSPQRGDVVSFQINAESRLVATLATGETSASEGKIGELLLVLPAERGEARVLASSPALPGEPDRILEFRWDGLRLSAGRKSREFSGRVAAAVQVAAGRNALAIAAIERPGHSRVHIVSEDELWEAP